MYSQGYNEYWHNNTLHKIQNSLNYILKTLYAVFILPPDYFPSIKDLFVRLSIKFFWYWKCLDKHDVEGTNRRCRNKKCRLPAPRSDKSPQNLILTCIINFILLRLIWSWNIWFFIQELCYLYLCIICLQRFFFILAAFCF